MFSIKKKLTKFKKFHLSRFKLFQIFNVICTSSDLLAHKLFQIVFNTPKFIENKTNSMNDKPSTNELTKKLKELILSKNRKNKSNSSEDIIDYYLKFSCISDEIASTDDYIKMFNNGSLFSSYYLFLKNLFKVFESIFLLTKKSFDLTNLESGEQ